MTDRIALRPAVLHDAPELATLAGELGYPSTAEELGQRLAPLLGDVSHLVLVAVAADDRAVGWLHATARRQLESDDFVEVVALVQLRSNVIRERAHGF